MALPPPYMKARKRFGQNFLVNNHIITSIVDAINPHENEFLVEIGPGHAALTRPVLERAKKLTAIELDRDLAERLRHDPFLKGLELIEADALKVDYSKLPGAAEGKLRIFGNLPYNITSPLLFHLLHFEGIQDLHFMLQKEVVERLAAAPGSKDYGRLTVMAQFHAAVLPILTVPPSAFVPPPKVMSAVVRLKPKALTPEERALAPFLNKITTTAFAARRKTVRNSLALYFSPEELEALQINQQDRAEDLPLEVYVNLAQALKNKTSIEELNAQESQQQQEKHEKRLAKLQATSPEAQAAARAAAAEAAAANAAGANAAGADAAAAASAATDDATSATTTAAEAAPAEATPAPAAEPVKLSSIERNKLRKAAAKKKKGSIKSGDFDVNDIYADL